MSSQPTTGDSKVEKEQEAAQVHELWLLRHAKSSWADGSMNDHDRPLNDRGLREAPAVDQWMRERRISPSAVLCSSARRATETANLGLASWIDAGGEVQIRDQLYLAPPGDLLELAHQTNESIENLLMIGHNPGLEELASVLARSRVEMKTANLFRIRFEGSWSRLSSHSKIVWCEQFSAKHYLKHHLNQSAADQSE